MTISIPIDFPGIALPDGSSPVVILGPNGSGKTRLAQQITRSGEWIAIGAQRRTWLNDQLPIMEELNQNSHINQLQANWTSDAWRPTEEIDHVFSKLTQEHLRRLTKNNEAALEHEANVAPISDTNLIKLQRLWKKIYPYRKLEIDGFFPKVSRTDQSENPIQYQARYMSDGERTTLYIAAKVLTAEHKRMLIDEPELHLHSRLAIELWSELEHLRSDCRFVYITHDLNFALSRRNGTILTITADSKLQLVDADLGQVAGQILGAATLPFHAKRIVFYEGEDGRGFASRFFETWFNDPDTFVVAAGNRDGVCASVVGLKKIKVSGAEVLGFVDRDYYPDEANHSLPNGIKALDMHEIESLICSRQVVEAIATHLGKNPVEIWPQFTQNIQYAFKNKTLNNFIAQRVRSRIGDLLNNVFSANQIAEEFDTTVSKHQSALSNLQSPEKLKALFVEEQDRIQKAISEESDDMVRLLPGKHLLALLAKTLGYSGSRDLEDLLVSALGSNAKNPALQMLRQELENVLTPNLASRKLT